MGDPNTLRTQEKHAAPRALVNSILILILYLLDTTQLTGVSVLRELPADRRLLAAAHPPSHLRVVLQQAVVQQRPVVQVLRRDIVHGSS